MKFDCVHRAVLLTDLVDSAAYTEKVGDLAFVTLMSTLEREVRALIRHHDGREIDKTDGFLVVFEQPLDALAFALELTSKVAEISQSLSLPVQLRTGLHFGTLILRGNSPEDVASGAKALEADGLTKVIAARIMGLAEPGQLLITRTLFDTLREDEKLQTQFGTEIKWMAHGAYLLHGLQEPVEIFEVGREGEAPLTPPVDKNKARRAILPQDEIALGWRPATGQNIPNAEGWQLARKLGEGGYGEVWVGQRRDTREFRVFKFCFEASRIQSLKREKFLLEIIQEKLGQQDGIVSILDWNLHDPPFFIGLAYIPHENLTTWLDRRPTGGPLPEDSILKIVRKTATAVGTAHSAGVLHKDIKPSNLLVGGSIKDPIVNLIDFGIGLYTPQETAGAADMEVISGAGYTTMRTSILSGSRMYIAPELLEGNLPTPQADIYPLGVLLYQLLRNDLRTGLNVGWERDVSDPLLAAIIARATDGDLKARFASTADFLAALDHVESKRRLALMPPATRRTSFIDEKWLGIWRRHSLTMSLGALTLMFVTCSAYLGYTAYGYRKAAKEAMEQADKERFKARNIATFMMKDVAPGLQQIHNMALLDTVSSRTLAEFESETSNSLTRDELFFRTRALLGMAESTFSAQDMDTAAEYFRLAEADAEYLFEQDKLNRDYLELLADAKAGLADIGARCGGDIEVSKLKFDVVNIRKRIALENPRDTQAIYKYLKAEVKRAGKYEDGAPMMDDAVKLVEPLLATAPEGRDVQYVRAMEAFFLSLVRNPKQFEEAFLPDGVHDLETLHNQDPLNAQYIESLVNCYTHLGRFNLNLDLQVSLELLQRANDAARTFKYSPIKEQQRIAATCDGIYSIALAGNGDHEASWHHAKEATRVLAAQTLLNPIDKWIYSDFWDIRLQELQSVGLIDDFQAFDKTLHETNEQLRTAFLNGGDFIYFSKALLYNSLEIAANQHDPKVLAEAMDVVRTASKDRVLTQPELDIIKCHEAILGEPAVFAEVELAWSSDNSTSSGRHFLVVKNQTPEVFIAKLYKRGSSRPFITRTIMSNKDGNFINRLAYFCSGGFGISINDSPVRPLSKVGTVDPATNEVIIDIRQWLATNRNEVLYRIEFPG